MNLKKYVAVKCTYNNGNEGGLVGFHGTCSEDIIKLNIANHVWCRQPGCECKKYFDQDFKGKIPVEPCLESILFKEWWFGAGTYHSGKKKGQPKSANLEAGGVALLTTRFPGDREEDRKIIGLYKIAKVSRLKGKETKFYADKNLRIRLPLNEAKQLYFWDYYSINSNKPSWCTGLLRYFKAGQIKNVLLDLNDTVRSVTDKGIIVNLLNDFRNITPAPKGLRRKKISRRKSISTKRKYGAGGEGENHKKLKKWVAKHPESIGLTGVKKYELEYVFLSGDTVDILFEMTDGCDAVVEIETTVPFPGAHQAIKYRVLRCAERLLSLDSKKIKAILVAWEIPSEIKRFCEKYQIKFFEIKK
ncbi:MAG: hypothetical protein GY847_22855 [Proteobacteria bacterium]|nr:hypothetical protein [Pseudomonadota bacterium]